MAIGTEAESEKFNLYVPWYRL